MTLIPEPLQSLRGHAGRQLQPVQEALLTKAALKVRASLPGSHRGLIVLREVVGPYGIPDQRAASPAHYPALDGTCGLEGDPGLRALWPFCTRGKDRRQRVPRRLVKVRATAI